jgi:CubicO group peptidase (beta-lactamase class C family)
MTHTGGFGYAFCNRTLADLNEALIKREVLLYDPGTQWTYGVGINILGQVIEAITEQSLAACLTRRIFEPLGMTDTSFSVPETKRSRLPTAYVRSENGFVVYPDESTRKPTGGGGLHATAEDYARFLRMLLNRGKTDERRILSEASVEAMITNRIGDVPVPAMPATSSMSAGWLPLDGTEQFGLGFLLAGTSKPGFRAKGSYSWAGIANTFFWVDPDRDLAATLLIQVLPFCDKPTHQPL